ncbi:MAG: hypothetical protein WCW13_04040 [archaeon]
MRNVGGRRIKSGLGKGVQNTAERNKLARILKAERQIARDFPQTKNPALLKVIDALIIKHNGGKVPKDMRLARINYFKDLQHVDRVEISSTPWKP